MTESATLAKHVTVSDAGPCRKKLAFDIPADAVEEKVAESFDALATSVSLPGFRAGKAPKGLIEKRFGEEIRKEARSQIISTAYQDAVKDHELKVVGDPIADELGDLEVEAGKGLAFEIDVEVLPEFDLPALEGLDIKKPTFEVSDEMVSKELDKICLHEGDLEEREVAEAGDYITGHGVMTASGSEEPIHDIPGAVVQAPEDDAGMILGVRVEDLKKQLGLPKAGDTVTIKTKGPDQHEVEAVRGADLEITWKVERIDRVVKAKPEDIAEQNGFENVDALKTRLSERLQQQVVVEQQMAMREQVAKHLTENTTFDLPERLTAQQAERTLNRQRMELMYRGVDQAQVEEHIAEMRNASSEQAQRELKLFFILSKVAEKNQVRITEGEVAQRITQMAIQANMRPEQMRDMLIQQNRINGIAQQILEHKALDSIIAKSSVEEISADDWKKLNEKA